MSSSCRTPPQPGSILARWLEPFAAGLWIVFVLWTLAVAFVWLSGVGDAELERGVTNPDLRAALSWALSALDGLWLMLAAANIYVPLAAAEGLKTIRRWAAISVLAGWAVAALSAWEGFPLGPIAYSERLGMKLGPAPFGVPLLWFVLVFGARGAVLRFAPRAGHLRVALFTGALVMLSDLNLEPIAWKLRVWWLWYPRRLAEPSWPPVSAFLTWFAVSTALAFVFREQDVARRGKAPPLRPAIVFVMINTLFLLAHLRPR